MERSVPAVTGRRSPPTGSGWAGPVGPARPLTRRCTDGAVAGRFGILLCASVISACAAASEFASSALLDRLKKSSQPRW